MFPICWTGGMGNGKWTRWGRGSCEGYSLDIGYALRGQVVRNHDGCWRASLNATDLGNRHKTPDDARLLVEQRIAHAVQLIQEDWAIWQSALASASRAEKKPLTHPDTGQTDTP